MDSLNRWSSEHEEQRAQVSREELVARLAQVTHDNGISEPLDGVRLHRASTPTEIGHGVSFPSCCVIAQGSKEVLLGDKRYWYDSAHYHHFRALTAMSPLQFQKQLRLQEARRLMLGEGLDAASAGYRVGYDDASYFNREYKKLFGEPPMRDIERLRGGATESVGQGTV